MASLSEVLICVAFAFGLGFLAGLGVGYVFGDK